MMNIGKYLPHYTPGGIPEYRDGPVFTKVIPIASKEVTKTVPEKVHTEVGDDFRVKFRRNFSVTGKQLDRMIGMVMKLSSGKPLIVNDLAKEYNVSIRTIHEDLRRLGGWGMIKFEGPPKTGIYVLTRNGRSFLEETGDR